MLYPQAFAAESILAKRYMHTHGRILRYIPNTDCEPHKSKWPKEIQKKYPTKVIQTTTKAKLRDSLSLSESFCMSIHTYCILFPANKCFTFFTASHLYGNFISTKLCGLGPYHWSLVIGPVARLSTFTTAAQPQSLAGNRNPVSSCSKSRPPEIRKRSKESACPLKCILSLET